MVAAVDIKIEVLTEFLNDLDKDCKERNDFTCFVFDQNGFIIGSVIENPPFCITFIKIKAFFTQNKPIQNGWKVAMANLSMILRLNSGYGVLNLLYFNNYGPR